MNRAAHIGIVGLLLLFPLGCTGGQSDTGPGEPEETTKAEGAGKLRPPKEVVEIILEAEDGEVTPDMVVREFDSFVHPDAGRQEASGGKCVVIPRHANKACKDKNQARKKAGKPPLPFKGKLVLTFKVPEDGAYYVWPRVMWGDGGGCENSVGFRVDDGKPLVLTSGTYTKWLWFKIRPLDPKSELPRAFKLDAGEHTLTFTNTEDNIKIDQVYITSDAKEVPPPGQIMEKMEPLDFSF